MADLGMVDWGQIAATVSASFVETGIWGNLDEWLAGERGELPDTESGDPVKSFTINWSVEAARVVAYHDATGSWGNLSDWLGDTDQPSPAPVPATQQIAALASIETIFGTDGPDIFAVGYQGGSRSGAQGRIATGVGEGNRDVIVGFEQGEDIIDLSLVNWVSEQSGAPGTEPFPGFDLVFDFIGSNQFTDGGGSRPELRYEILSEYRTVLQMDGIRTISFSDSDGEVDAELLVIGRIDFQTADFVL